MNKIKSWFSNSTIKTLETSLEEGMQKDIIKAKEEIKAAVSIDTKKNSKFPKMPSTAHLLRSGHLPDGLVHDLADFLECTHRTPKGRPSHPQDDIERAKLWHQWSFVEGHGSSRAYEMLADREGFAEIRSAERAVKRGIDSLKEEVEELQFSSLELKFEIERLEREKEKRQPLLRSFFEK